MSNPGHPQQRLTELQAARPSILEKTTSSITRPFIYHHRKHGRGRILSTITALTLLAATTIGAYAQENPSDSPMTMVSDGSADSDVGAQVTDSAPVSVRDTIPQELPHINLETSSWRILDGQGNTLGIHVQTSEGAKATDLSTWGHQVMRPYLDALQTHPELGDPISNSFTEPNGRLAQGFKGGFIEIGADGTPTVLGTVSLTVPDQARSLTPPPDTPRELFTHPNLANMGATLSIKNGTVVYHNSNSGFAPDYDTAYQLADGMQNPQSQTRTCSIFTVPSYLTPANSRIMDWSSTPVADLITLLDPDRTYTGYVGMPNGAGVAMFTTAGMLNRRPDGIILAALPNPQTYADGTVKFPGATLQFLQYCEDFAGHGAAAGSKAYTIIGIDKHLPWLPIPNANSVQLLVSKPVAPNPK